MSNDYQKKAEVGGQVKISENVICSIARVAALEAEGVARLAGQEGFSLKKQPAVSVQVVNDMVEITLRLVLRNGIRLTTAAEQVQKNVKESVQSMTGVIVSKVHVVAAGISFDD